MLSRSLAAVRNEYKAGIKVSRVPEEIAAMVESLSKKKQKGQTKRS